MSNINGKNWWFENQYGRSSITINDKNIIINHKGLTTISLKKQATNIILISNIKTVILKKPTFWQCGYFYIVLINEAISSFDEQVLLSNLCIALKRKEEFKEAQDIKNIIDKFIS